MDSQCWIQRDDCGAIWFVEHQKTNTIVTEQRKVGINQWDSLAHLGGGGATPMVGTCTALTGIDVYKIFAHENQFGLVPMLLPAIEHCMLQTRGYFKT